MSSVTDPVGAPAEHSARYRIDLNLWDLYRRGFGDENPMHVDPGFASAHGFAGPLAPGGILHGFLSNFVGTRFPGPGSVLLTLDIRYANPCFLDDEIEIEARVSQRVESENAVILELKLANLTRGTLAARGRASVRIFS